MAIIDELPDTERLKLQNLLFKTILEEVPIEIAVYDADFKYVYCNPQSIRNNTTRAWIIGKNDLDYCQYKGIDNTLALKRIEKFRQCIEKKESVTWEETFENGTTGKQICILRRITPLFDQKGKLKMLIGSGEDISTLNRVKEKVKAKKNEFKQIFKRAPIGIVKIDLSGKILKVNPATCETLGYQKKELLHKNLSEISHPEDMKIHLKKNEEMIAGQYDSFQMIKRYFHKNGKMLFVILRVSLIRDENNLPTYFLGQVVDITKQKDYELELESKNESLEKINRELMSFNLNISQKNSLLEEIKEKIGALKDENPDDLPQKLQQLYKLADRNTKIDNDWEEFKMHFERIHQDFLANLKKQFPSLSANDLRLCAYLRMNIATKEIAKIMGISPASANKARYRLRKKLGLKKDDDLISFIMEIGTN
jgi:PAS domain S-box-containing protein